MYGAAWMQLAVASCVAEEAGDKDPHRELNRYLESLLEPFHSLSDAALFNWWRNHCVVHPTLVRMAQDFLAIPGSSTASECQFSSVQYISTDF